MSWRGLEGLGMDFEVEGWAVRVNEGMGMGDVSGGK